MLEIRSFRDLLRLFFIFRREFQWAVIVTIVVAVLGAFLLPAKYESNARLLVKPSRESTTLPIEVANRQALIAPSTQRDPIVDEEKMLTGRTVVRMVAEHYIAEMANYKPQGFWKTVKFYIGKVTSSVINVVRSCLQLLGIVEAQTDVERLSKGLEKNFSVSHEPGSAVMEISFTWDDPGIAQLVVDAWIDAYLEQRTKALGRKSLYAFYEGEMIKVAEQVDVLKLDLQKHLQLIGSISVKERLENLTSQINRLQDARAEKLNDKAGISSFLADAQLQIKRLPQEVVTAREVSLNPSQLDLKRRLNALEQERAALLRTYLADTPPVREVEESIAQMQALINKQSERLERSLNLAPNGILVNIKQQIIDAQLRNSQLTGQLNDYTAQLSKLTQERERVMQGEPKISQLLLQLASAEKSYALYAENLEKARIDQELDNSRISNIALLEQATFNPSRVFPKSLMILLLAIPAGLAVGLLTLYACYLLDQRIHDGGCIEETFATPLWSTLQELGEQPWQPSPAFTASLYRLYSLLPSATIESQGLTLALTSARRGEGVTFVIDQLTHLLAERGHPVRHQGGAPTAGEILILDAGNLMNNQDAFIALHRADLTALVVEAKNSTVPMVQHALSVLHTAFGKVDGIILNRRQFEVPGGLLQWFSLLRDTPQEALRQLRNLWPSRQRTEPVLAELPSADIATEAQAAPNPSIQQSGQAFTSATAPQAAYHKPAPFIETVASAPTNTGNTTSTEIPKQEHMNNEAQPLPLSSYDWGNSQLLESGARHRLLRQAMLPGQGLASHFHLHRSKCLSVISGLLQVEIDGELRHLRAGDSLHVNFSQVHSLSNPGFAPLHFYEIQQGDYFGDEDITFVSASGVKPA